MSKPLPPATIQSLSPPPGTAFPYKFFENASKHPFEPRDTALNLRNAWWLMDAAFLSYCPLSSIESVFRSAGIPATVQTFSGLSTQCYVAATAEWMVLVLRGTQVDEFWASVLDWAVDARFVPAPDEHGCWVHSGFLTALDEVWPDVSAHLRSAQQASRRPLWITGHSLGAALATIAASRCSYDSASGLTGLYTFGSPRVGDQRFAQSIHVPHWRFRNNIDVVTHVPLGLVFRHTGMLEFIDGAGHFHKNVDPQTELLLNAANVQLSIAAAENLQMMLRVAGPMALLPGLLADHAPINYAIRIWNCYDAS